MKKLIVLFLSICCLFIVFGEGSNADSKTTEAQTLIIPTAPISLDGHYHQTKDDIPNTTMSADISGNVIQINLKYNGLTEPYWVGSFNPGDDITQTFQVLSNADSAQMSESIFRSQDPTKTFTYQDGDLSYEFTLRGVTTTVHLSKGA
jgi:hypothetical protein